MERNGFREERVGSLSVLSVNGNLDTHGTVVLEETLDDLIERGVVDILLDVKRGGFIGSSGIQTVLRYAAHCRQHGGDLVLCGVSDMMRDVFGAMGLDRAVALYDDRTGALLARGSPPVRERRRGRDRRAGDRRQPPAAKAQPAQP
jgi:anti-sigma B factor antagonist